jgi:hypothetical protein
MEVLEEVEQMIKCRTGCFCIYKTHVVHDDVFNEGYDRCLEFFCGLRLQTFTNDCSDH